MPRRAPRRAAPRAVRTRSFRSAITSASVLEAHAAEIVPLLKDKGWNVRAAACGL